MDIEQELKRWEESLCPEIDAGALYARNKSAHVYKATHRVIATRELLFWRCHDLLTQAYFLGKNDHILGCRILQRSALETVATLIFLNQKTAAVLSGAESFQSYSDLTSQLLMGSRDESTPFLSINILTVFKHCDREYEGIEYLYYELSESLHPNFEGLCDGYSTVDSENFVTRFSNRWVEKYGKTWRENIHLLLNTFEAEYNEDWPELFEKLEKWLEANKPQFEDSRAGDSLTT